MNNELLNAFNNMLNDDSRLEPKVLIIDLLNLFIRNFCIIPTMDINGNHVGGTVGSLKSIGSVIRQFKPRYVYIVFDGPGGSKRRREIYPEYKSGRKMVTRVNRTYDMTTDKEEKELMKYELSVLAKSLLNLPVTTITIDHVECDDIIGYITNYYSNNTELKTVICSTDKDFLQLVNENITVWNPIKKKQYTSEKIVSDYKIHPNNFLLYRALTGDKSDNISGIKGLGIKTLLKHFPEFSLEKKIEVSDLINKSLSIKSKTINKIVNEKEIIERNLYLMSLSEINISDSNKLKVLERIRNPNTKLNKMGLTKILNSYNIMEVMRVNYNQWLATTFNSLVIND